MFSQYRLETPVSRADGATSQNFVVIGSLVSSLIFVNRIFRRYPNATVYHLFEGPNYYDNPNIIKPAFGNVAIFDATYSRCNDIDYVTNGDDQLVFEDSTSFNYADQLITKLGTPRGLGADAIATYPSVVQQSPFVGTANNFDQSIQGLASLSDERLAGVELANAQAIATRFNIDASDKFITQFPAIYTRHYRYIESQDPDGRRLTGDVLFGDLLDNYPGQYRPIANVSGVLFANITVNTNAGGRPYIIADVQYAIFDGTYSTISQAVVNLKGTIFDNVRIATIGGLPNLDSVSNAFTLPRGRTFPNPGLTTIIPSFYRSVYAVPIGTGLLAPNPGPVESNNRQQLSFTLPDPTSPGNNDIGWLIQAYTALKDLRTGQTAESGKTLLMVEGVCVVSPRAMYWNLGCANFVVVLNSPARETVMFQTFKDITNNLRAVFGDTTVIPEVEEQCATSGVCGSIDHYSQAQSFLFNDFKLLNNCSCLFPRVLNGNRT